MDINLQFEKLKEEYQDLKNKYSERSFKIMAINQLTSTIAMEKDVESLKYIISDMFFEVNLANKALALNIKEYTLSVIKEKNTNIKIKNINIYDKIEEFKYLSNKKVISLKNIKQENILPEIFDNFQEGYCITFDISKEKEREFYIIIIGEKAFGEYTEVDDEFLATVSGQIRIILENAVYNSIVEKKNQELNETIFNLQVMNYASTLLNTTLEIEELLKYVSDIFFEIFEARKFMIYDFNEDKNEFLIYSSSGYNFKTEKLKIKVNENYKFSLLSNHSIKNYREILNDDFFEKLKECFDFDEHTYLVPFVSQHSIVGVAILNSFKKIDQEFYDTLKIQITVSINNAKLYNAAITDGMTSTYNHTFFKRKLKMEMLKHMSTSIIMIDIDNFKKFNDTYGHVTGDRVIIEISSLMKKTVRKTDMVARYGGEEFAILLPNTKLGEARVIAERIREQVEMMVIEYGKTVLKVTISLGVSEFNKTETIEMDEFIANADMALYESKRNGKNRITIYK